MYVFPENTWVLYFIPLIRSNRKSQTSVSLGILNMMIPPIHFQSTYVSLPSIGTSWSNWNYRIYPMRNAKRKTKEIRSTAENKILPLSPPLFTENGEMNWWIHRILGRDWRGSNPQLPPWQGGALTDWTTIPGKWVIQHTYSYNFFLFIIAVFYQKHEWLIFTWIWTIVKVTQITSNPVVIATLIDKIIHFSMKKRTLFFFTPIYRFLI